MPGFSDIRYRGIPEEFNMRIRNELRGSAGLIFCDMVCVMCFLLCGGHGLRNVFSALVLIWPEKCVFRFAADMA